MSVEKDYVRLTAPNQINYRSMREIKFRAWDNKNSRWLDGPTFSKDLRMTMSGGLTLLSKVAEEYGIDVFGIELAQFTGLKDKNGKEIWEGDVVRRWCGGEDFCERNRMTGTIEWRDTEFFVRGHDIKIKVKGGSHNGTMQDMGTVHSWVGMHSCMRNGQLQVIGNIYENPELLTPHHMM